MFKDCVTNKLHFLKVSSFYLIVKSGIFWKKKLLQITNFWMHEYWKENDKYIYDKEKVKYNLMLGSFCRWLKGRQNQNPALLTVDYKTPTTFKLLLYNTTHHAAHFPPLEARIHSRCQPSNQDPGLKMTSKCFGQTWLCHLLVVRSFGCFRVCERECMCVCAWFTGQCATGPHPPPPTKM